MNSAKTMITPIALRLAEEKDTPCLRAIYADSRWEEMAQVGNWSADEKRAFLASQFEAQKSYYISYYPGCQFYIIEVDGYAAGRFYLYRADNDICIMDIAVLHPFRRRGIATHLINEVLDEAATHSRTVSLHVEPNNPAKQLYLSFGFVVVDEISLYQKMVWTPIAVINSEITSNKSSV